ncbi:hypothetical protein [Conexibacter sp. CPCC 206217]|uniref:hypothetical protein n=1 Tax=Conexibacter sp. CPCC 206217 TaxID=3064574 RepID=UPI00271B6FF0|nr:hypothetical protein [Conexibacter sp. CPCC 206217]MDO8213916.1 hypothetical protein [Conexibacter sp. CPCC 206217]
MLLADAYVKVVKGPAVDNDGAGYYACARGNQRGVYLFSQDFTPFASQLSGRFVADETVTCDTRMPDNPYCVGYVIVYDSRTRRIRRTTLRKSPVGYVRRAEGFAVNARGWASWLRSTPDGYNMWVWAPGAQPQVVASSQTIEPFSLALTSHTAYWTDGGQPRSYALR